MNNKLKSLRKCYSFMTLMYDANKITICFRIFSVNENLIDHMGN